MAIKYWMISNRNVTKAGLGADRSSLSYWVSENDGLDDFAKWGKVGGGTFIKSLAAVADAFPVATSLADQEDQKHVTLFVHGFNNDWKDAVRRYESLCGKLFASNGGLGYCVLFTWPSDGMTLGYLPDRADARSSGEDLADVLSDLFDWLLDKQEAGAADPAKACKAKTSLIAHSMGNYVLQNAIQVCWTRKNQPLLLSLINQLVMVAADVDNDLFKSGEQVDKGDGDAIANLCYRITVLYSGLDSVLGLSAGMKHFGKRRLGRSGLDRTCPVPDNVWDVDCSPLIAPDTKNVHSIYFEKPKIIDLMREVLRGVDRTVLVGNG
jgi:esterase/lipase superfamily enzyme